MGSTHSTVVTVPDDGVSPVGSDEWNAGHNDSLASSEVLLQQERYVLGSGERLTVANAARMRLVEATDGIRGSYNAGSQEVYNDNFMIQYKRTGLTGNARLSLFGTGELYVFDLAPVGRLVLAGRGL